jgi:hypothetical protein
MAMTIKPKMATVWFCLPMALLQDSHIKTTPLLLRPLYPLRTRVETAVPGGRGQPQLLHLAITWLVRLGALRDDSQRARWAPEPFNHRRVPSKPSE